MKKGPNMNRGPHGRNPEQILMGKENRKSYKTEGQTRSGGPVRVYRNETPQSLVNDAKKMEELKKIGETLGLRYEAVKNKLNKYETENEINHRYRELIEAALNRYEENEIKKSEKEKAQVIPIRRVPGDRQISAIKRDQERKAA